MSRKSKSRSKKKAVATQNPAAVAAKAAPRDKPAVRPAPSSLGAAAPQKAAERPASSRASPMAVVEAAQKAQNAQLFANAVAVMMRDPAYRQLRLSDLEPLLLPAIIAGQCVVAEAPDGRGAVIPVAVALWACLSEELDQRLSRDPDKVPSLTLPQWRSGETVWLMALAGDPRALPAFVRGLLANQFKDKLVKVRAAGKDGKRRVEVLSTPLPAQ